MFITVKCPVQCPPASLADQRQRKAICRTKRIIERARRKRVNIERHIPRSLIQRSSLCVACFLFNVQYYHVPCRWPSANERTSEIADKVKVSCVIAIAIVKGKMFIISWRCSRLNVWFLTWNENDHKTHRRGNWIQSLTWGALWLLLNVFKHSCVSDRENQEP